MLKIYVALLSAFFTSFCLADSSKVYKNYQFLPEFSVKTKGSITPELAVAYSSFFDESSDFSKKSILHYFKISSGKYFIHAVRPANVSDKTKNMFSNDNFSASSTNGKQFQIIGVLDVVKKSIHRVLSSSVSDMSWKSALGSGLSYNGREGNLAYGCQVDEPFRYQDLNLDGVPELIFIGGTGEFYRDPNGNGVDIGIQTIIRIFDLAGEQPKQIFFGTLSTENYGSEYFAEENGIFNPGYQSFSTHKFLKNGKRVDSNVGHRAERFYNKLYFSDFDKDGKLNLIILGKKYLSNALKNKRKGFELSESIHEVYELEADGFIPEKVTSELIQDFFSENNLSWKKGWPNKNLCKVFGYLDGKFRLYSKNDPIILDLTNNPFHSLNDLIKE